MSCMPRQLSFGLAAVLTLSLAQRGDAANPAVAKIDVSQVREALLAETDADAASIDRRGLLRPDSKPESAPDIAWWQSGFVKRGAAWIPAGTAAPTADQAVEQQYRQQREAAAMTAEGQLKLANWCRDHHLADQERAHLQHVLRLSSGGTDPTSIYRRMGYVQAGADWVPPATIQEMQRASRQNAADLRAWRSAAERIARNWSGPPKQQKLAISELKAIQSSKAVPALLMIAGTDESLALAICQQLDKLHTFEASRALASIAIMAPWSSVRDTAAEALQDHRLDHFVPELLSEMRTPYRQVSTGSNFDTPRIYLREDSDRYFAIDVQLAPVISASEIFVFGNRRDPLETVRNQVFTGRRGNDFVRTTEGADYDLSSRVEQANDVTNEYNERAAAILSQVSGQDPTLDPKFWWAWWCVYTGTVAPPKKCQVVYQQFPVRLQGAMGVRVISSHSCLIAGTPISTDRGEIAIDKIQIGDRVLAKNLATGEIDYKPVLQTTVRQPVPVRTFETNGTRITASSGHHFWVSGEGWKKTRELDARNPIHTVTGMSRVASIEDEPAPAPVYNLVVADFHTYFIGKAMVLSHDVTPPAPTNIKVPGLEE